MCPSSFLTSAELYRCLESHSDIRCLSTYSSNPCSKINLKDNFNKLINATNKVVKTDILAFSYAITRSFIKNTIHVDIDDVKKIGQDILNEYNQDKNYLKELVN